jgi:hypothetical protein
VSGNADDFPPKFKPTLTSNYLDCLSTPWKTPILSLKVTYLAHKHFCKIVVNDVKSAKVTQIDCGDVNGKEPVEVFMAENCDWKKIAVAGFEECCTKIAEFGPNHNGSVEVDLDLLAGRNYVFYCSHKGNVCISGNIIGSMST